MSNFTNASARRLARQLCINCSKEKRKKIVDALDTEFKFAVLEEIAKIKDDMPLDMRDTQPVPPIPFVGHHDNG